jgi:hypothetical protein
MHTLCCFGIFSGSLFFSIYLSTCLDMATANDSLDQPEVSVLDPFVPASSNGSLMYHYTTWCRLRSQIHHYKVKLRASQGSKVLLSVCR